MNRFQKIVNTITGPLRSEKNNRLVIADPKAPVAVRNLSNTISPVQLQRLKHDINMWRAAVTEAELALYPHRVRMQRMYIDTVLNGQIFASMERRKDLTLLRDFEIIKLDKTPDETWTQYFQNAQWFYEFLNYALDTIFYGYSLIALGDVQGNEFKNINTVRRWNISPERENVTSLVYSISGTPFLEEPWSDWHIWATTPNPTGATSCGYGILYNIALYEIFLRNNLGFNADFVELFAMPYRVGKTTKTTETERAEFEQALIQMGAAGYALTDPDDSIEFLESKSSGTAYQSYDNLETRLLKVISKVILGHADAIDSTPGKLGAGGKKQDNPVTVALTDKQSKDGRFIETLVNSQLLPKLRNIGFNIPEDLIFHFKNDEEEEQFRQREDESNLATANVALAMKNAGLQMDAKYFSDRTGIPTTEIIMPSSVKKDPLTQDVKNKLEKFYANH
jgi:phage gp29-like protein